MTDKERIFLETYYRTGGNALQAYKDSHPGCKESTALRHAWEFAKKQNIQGALKEWREQMAERTEVAHTAINNHLLGRIFFDPLKFAKIGRGLDGSDVVKIEKLEDLTPEERQYIRGIKPTQSGIEVQFESRDKAIELYAKLNGLGADNVNINVATSPKLADIMQQLAGGGVFDDDDDA